MYTLKSITKRNNVFLYHIEVKKPDGIQYDEMRRHKQNSRYPEMLETLEEHLRTKNMSFACAVHEEIDLDFILSVQTG